MPDEPDPLCMCGHPQSDHYKALGACNQCKNRKPCHYFKLAIAQLPVKE